jgi:hypothetical protein
MLQSRTISVSIPRPWKEVYEAVWRPQDFARWASGLTRSDLQKAEADWWNAHGPDGPIRVRFSGHNAFGVMDHYVDLGTGSVIYIPMRIVANAKGAEVLLTLFHQPGMSEKQFARDAEWVARDLGTLKALIAAT